MVGISKKKYRNLIYSLIFLLVGCFCFFNISTIKSLLFTNLSVLSALKGNISRAYHLSLQAKKYGYLNSGQYYHQYMIDHDSADLKKAFLLNQSNVNYIFLFADETILTGDWLSSNQHFNNVPFSRYLARRGMEIAYDADPEQAKKGLYYLSFARKILSEAQISSFLGSVLCFKYKAYQKGETLLLDAVKRNPKNITFLDNLAQVNANKSKYVLYRSFKEINRRLNQSNVNTLLDIGTSLVKEDRLNEGLQYFISAKKKDPKLPLVYYKLAKVYEKLEKPLLAESEYREAIEFNSSDPGPRFEWGLSLFQKADYTRALTQFTIAITLKSDDLWSYYYRGLCYEKLKNYLKAKEDFERCLTIDPNNQSFKNKLEAITKEL